MKVVLLLSFCSALVHAQGKPIRMGGWFDFTKPLSNSYVVAVASNERLMAAAVNGAGRGAEITVYNSGLVEVARWKTIRAPRYLAVADSHIVVGYEDLTAGSFNACMHQIDGSLGAACLNGEGWPIKVVGAGDKFYALREDGIDQLDFLNQKATTLPGVTSIGGDAASFATAGGSKLIRIDPVTLNGSSFDTLTNTDTPLTYLSPQLAANRSNRGVNEMLIAALLGRNSGEVLVMHGKQSIYTGIPIGRFDGSGRYVSTILLETPQFDELKRFGSPMPLMSNPTGHMVPSHLAVLGHRLLIVDSTALRCAWFDLP